MLREGRLVAVSPHFNDAAASCAGLLAARPDSTVLTVYSGMPLLAGHVSDADRSRGFTSGRQAVQARHALSDQALSLLGVRGAQMDLLDGQYLVSGEEGRLTGALAAALSALRPRVILMPLGLGRAAHVRVSDACLTIRALFQRVEWITYEEVADGEPGVVQERLASLLRRHILASPIDVAAQVDMARARDRARAARNCLAGNIDEAALPAAAAQGAPHPERYWRLSWRRDQIA